MRVLRYCPFIFVLFIVTIHCFAFGYLPNISDGTSTMSPGSLTGANVFSMKIKTAVDDNHQITRDLINKYSLELNDYIPTGICNYIMKNETIKDFVTELTEIQTAGLPTPLLKCNHAHAYTFKYWSTTKACLMEKNLDINNMLDDIVKTGISTIFLVDMTSKNETMTKHNITITFGFYWNKHWNFCDLNK